MRWHAPCHWQDPSELSDQVLGISATETTGLQEPELGHITLRQCLDNTAIYNTQEVRGSSSYLAPPSSSSEHGELMQKAWRRKQGNGEGHPTAPDTAQPRQREGRVGRDQCCVPWSEHG